MNSDLRNVVVDKKATAAAPTPTAAPAAGTWPEMEAAIDLAGKDVDKFLATYFGDAPDRASKGLFSATSR